MSPSAFATPLPKPDLTTVRDALPSALKDLGAEWLEPAPRAVVVNSANRPWSVIESEILERHLAPLELTEFYYAPSGRPFEPTEQALDARVSEVAALPQLLVEIARLRPALIYLRVSPHTGSEHLVSVFRALFPKARLWVEFYDASCLFGPSYLLEVTFPDRAALARAWEACAVAFHTADAVVVKMGGARFEAWQKDYPAPMVSFFPALARLAEPAPPRPDRVRRVLYAGALSARELTGGLGAVPGANLVRYFDAVGDDPRLCLDIVNAVHGGPAEDHAAKFKALLDRYPLAGAADQPIRYHRAMTRDALIDFSAGHALGICATHYAEDKVMEVTRMGLPNRVMTYLAAGLPAVLDDRFEFAAELIGSEGAGAVIAAGDFGGFVETLATLDLSAARAGCARLRQAMLRANDRSLAALRQLLFLAGAAS